ncbi:putative ribonuclease H-like domain-containing protein [Tanacetum coccineum]
MDEKWLLSMGKIEKRYELGWILVNTFVGQRVSKWENLKTLLSKGLQVQQKHDGIFISKDKYVGEILKKFGFTEVKTASTPMETQKPLLKDDGLYGLYQKSQENRKTGKHGHEERKSTKEARDAKPKAGKVKKSKLWSTLGQFSHLYTQEEGIDYDKVFAPVARIEANRLFLAYASFKDFVVYQMDVKSAFIYGNIEEELLELGYETLSTNLLDNECQRRNLTKPIHQKMSSMGELTFFLGLQVQQKHDGMDKTKITKKLSKTGKHGREEQKSTKEARDAKPKAGKVKKSKLWSTLGQFSVNKIKTSSKASYWLIPTKNDMVEERKAQGKGHFTLNLLSEKAQGVTIMDCHAGNPCVYICDPTANANDPMIRKMNGRD